MLAVGEGAGGAVPPASRSRLSLDPCPDLNRFSTTRYSIKKCSVFVDFPLQQLNLREFASEKAGEPRRWRGGTGTGGPGQAPEGRDRAGHGGGQR